MNEDQKAIEVAIGVLREKYPDKVWIVRVKMVRPVRSVLSQYALGGRVHHWEYGDYDLATREYDLWMESGLCSMVELLVKPDLPARLVAQWDDHYWKTDGSPKEEKDGTL